MSHTVELPALGESVTEGTVTRWLVAVGDTVAVDDPIVEVSTDKVDTEIPSPVAGVVEQILVEEDEDVEVGAALVVIGDGPEFQKTKAIAKENIQILGYQPFQVLKDHMQRAKAFVFAAEEDFGIVPVEAQACGTPVIAYGKGGALETVIGMSLCNATGLFFPEQSIDAIQEAVTNFETQVQHISAQNCRRNAERFSAQEFRHQFQGYVEDIWNR